MPFSPPRAAGAAPPACRCVCRARRKARCGGSSSARCGSRPWDRMPVRFARRSCSSSAGGATPEKSSAPCLRSAPGLAFRPASCSCPCRPLRHAGGNAVSIRACCSPKRAPLGTDIRSCLRYANAWTTRNVAAPGKPDCAPAPASCAPLPLSSPACASSSSTTCSPPAPPYAIAPRPCKPAAPPRAKPSSSPLLEIRAATKAARYGSQNR